MSSWFHLISFAFTHITYLFYARTLTGYTGLDEVVKPYDTVVNMPLLIRFYNFHKGLLRHGQRTCDEHPR
jgi:hypothetical protein